MELNNRAQELVSYPDPHTAVADELHHRYAKSGSGEVLYSFCTRMLVHQSDLRYAVIAFFSYCTKLLLIAMVMEDVQRTNG